jgi:hypothetical protein
MPAKAGIQYSENEIEPISRGVLDHPLSRMMTSQAARPVTSPERRSAIHLADALGPWRDA